MTVYDNVGKNSRVIKLYDISPQYPMYFDFNLDETKRIRINLVKTDTDRGLIENRHNISRQKLAFHVARHTKHKEQLDNLYKSSVGRLS